MKCELHGLFNEIFGFRYVDYIYLKCVTVTMQKNREMG